MAKPIMARATAVWLVDNTTLSFKQIADFVGMHELEVQGIADGDVAQGVKGFDPIANNQLTEEEIEKGQASPLHKLKLKFNASAQGEEKRRGPRYTPLSKRQDRPASIYWLVKFHPELSDGQISKLVGTTKPTIQSVRDKSHYNMANLRPVDPVALGFCKQMELDAAVTRAAARKAKEDGETMSDEEKKTLMSTEASLHADPVASGSSSSAPSRPQKDFSGLENFSILGGDDEDEKEDNLVDADSLFNLPKGKGDEDEQP